MSIQREKTAARLVRPDLDLVIVTARDEQGLRFVEVDATNRAIVFLEPVNQCAHSIVPELNG
jgi:hypothetical protein